MSQLSNAAALAQLMVAVRKPISDRAVKISERLQRVTASVVLQRHVTVSGRRGLRVIARRAPSGSGGVQWVYEYDEGVDPGDPAVRDLARTTLEAMRLEVGMP